MVAPMNNIRLRLGSYVYNSPKLDAGRKIEALHRDSWEPAIREWRGNAVLIYRNLNGWQYRFIQHDSGPLLVSRCSSCGYEDRQDAITHAERHIADIGWTCADPLDAFPVWFGTDANREHTNLRREIIDGRKWQLQMRHLVNAGIPDETARRAIAGLESLPEGVSLLTL